MLSRAINNPGDLKKHMGDKDTMTLFSKHDYHPQIVEHFKNNVNQKIKLCGFNVCSDDIHL